MYTLGAIANARHANRAYPGWVCRFYVADDVPENVISRLKDYGVEIVNMGQYVGHEGMRWRFFAAVDPEVDITLVRDADSRFTKCELIMVNEWLASGKKFHVMRWDLARAAIMGGLWGVRGPIPELKKSLENFSQSPDSPDYDADQTFLRNYLYPLTKGDVFVHELDSQAKRTYYMEETIHPYPLVAEDIRGKYQIGLKVRSRRNFVALSIYKRTPLSEYFLAQLFNDIEKQEISDPIDTERPYLVESFVIRFYVADDIRPDLVERLRRLGQVVLKPAKTVHKDDPQYWKLSILTEKNLGKVIITNFWGLFALTRFAEGKIVESPLIEYDDQLESSQNGRVEMVALDAGRLNAPVANIDDLIAQRNPAENYQEFTRSVLYPKISTMRIPIKLNIKRGIYVALVGWSKMLLPVGAYSTLARTKNYLKGRTRRVVGRMAIVRKTPAGEAKTR